MLLADVEFTVTSFDELYPLQEDEDDEEDVVESPEDAAVAVLQAALMDVNKYTRKSSVPCGRVLWHDSDAPRSALVLSNGCVKPVNPHHRVVTEESAPMLAAIVNAVSAVQEEVERKRVVLVDLSWNDLTYTDLPAVRSLLELLPHWRVLRLDTNVLAADRVSCNALAEFLQGLGSEEHTVSLTNNGVASHAQVIQRLRQSSEHPARLVWMREVAVDGRMPKTLAEFEEAWKEQGFTDWEEVLEDHRRYYGVEV